MADLLWPARSFLRKLSGNPSNATVRSRSAGPPEWVKDKIFAEHLSQLRREIEDKTECLNDSSFEATEDWLFTFAGQHAEYMEQATSRAVTRHTFRSTTDLLQHVLQHPSVMKLMGHWHSQELPSDGDHKLAAVDAAHAWSPGSTEAPTSPEYLPEYPELGDGLDILTHDPEKPLRRASLPSQRSQASADGESKSKLPQRMSLPAAPPTGDGELMEKLRQRATWNGLSPCKQRHAGTVNSGSESSEVPAAATLAERRKLLEGKLTSCGFQKAAAGGA